MPPRARPRPRRAPGPRPAPPLLLFLGLLAIGLIVNAGRLGLDLAGGRLLPVGDLPSVWSEYLATWHPVAGGTAAPAPTAMAVIGGLGTVFLPFGGTRT